MRFQSIKCSDTLHFSTKAYGAIKFVMSLKGNPPPPTPPAPPERAQPCARLMRPLHRHQRDAEAAAADAQEGSLTSALQGSDSRQTTDRLSAPWTFLTSARSTEHADHLFITFPDGGAHRPVSPHRVSKLLICARSTSSSSFSGRSSR